MRLYSCRGGFSSVTSLQIYNASACTRPPHGDNGVPNPSAEARAAEERKEKKKKKLEEKKAAHCRAIEKKRLQKKEKMEKEKNKEEDKKKEVFYTFLYPLQTPPLFSFFRIPRR